MTFHPTALVLRQAPTLGIHALDTISQWYARQRPWPTAGGCQVAKATPRGGGRSCFHIDADQINGRTTANGAGVALCGVPLVKSGFQQYTNTQIAAELCADCAALAPDDATRFVGMHHYKQLPTWLGLLCRTVDAADAADTWATSLAARHGCATLATILAGDGDRDGADALVWLEAAFAALTRLAVTAADRDRAMRTARRTVVVHETQSTPYRETSATTLAVIADGATLHDWLDTDGRVPIATQVTAAIGRLEPHPLTAAATRDLASVVTDVDIPAGTNLRELVIGNWTRRVLRRAEQLDQLWNDARRLAPHDPTPACRIELDVTRTHAERRTSPAGYGAAWPMLLAYTDPDRAPVSTEPGDGSDPLHVTVPVAVAYACTLVDPAAFQWYDPPDVLVVAARLINDHGNVSGALSALAAAHAVVGR